MSVASGGAVVAVAASRAGDGAAVVPSRVACALGVDGHAGGDDGEAHEQFLFKNIKS